MVVVSATPHLRAAWSFGRPQGLRALAVVLLCLALTLFTLPAVQPLWGASDASAPTFGPVPQFLLGFWTAGAGLLLLLQASRLARADAGLPTKSAARVTWALVTLAAGFGVLALIPLRLVLAEGRFAGDNASWTIGLVNAFVGLTILLFGIEALRPRRPGRHAGMPRRPHVVSARVTSGPARPATSSPISGVDIVAAGTPPQAAPFGYTHHAWLNPTPRLGRPPSIVLSAVPRRMLYAPEMALPLRILVLMIGLSPFLVILLNLLS